jgi:hypothetical protein
MIVILCHPSDAAAVWLGTTLQHLGIGGVEIVTVEQVVFSRRIVYRLSDGGDSGSIELADGRVLHSERMTGLVNRVQYLPTQHFAAAAPADRDYATAELSAFMLAWLNGTAARVINPPLPFALGGGVFQMPTAMHFASMAGLPTLPWCASASDVGASVIGDNGIPMREPAHSSLVFEGRVYGPLLPSGLRDGCRQLAALLGVPLLQILFNRSSEHGWRFAAATSAVDFRIGGRPLAVALARELKRSTAA